MEILHLVACQLSFMEVTMLIPIKQHTSTTNVGQVLITKLNTEIIDRLI